MSERHQFVPRSGWPRNLAAIVLALAAVRAVPAGPSNLEVQPSARAFAPGEVVRFEVAADPEVRELRGTFEGKSLVFTPAQRTGTSGLFIAWGVIPLDAKPGPSPFSIAAKGASGSPVSRDGKLTIAAKSFPEQRLTVAPKFVNPKKAVTARIEREKKRLDAIYATRTPLPPRAARGHRPQGRDRNPCRGLRAGARGLRR